MGLGRGRRQSKWYPKMHYRRVALNSSARQQHRGLEMQQLVLSVSPCSIIKGSRDAEHAGVITWFRSRLIMHLHMTDRLDLGFENNGMYLKLNYSESKADMIWYDMILYFVLWAPSITWLLKLCFPGDTSETVDTWRCSPSKNVNSAIIYSPSSCSKPVWISLFCWTQKKIFWRMLVTKQLLVATDF